ncbi:NGEF protein, partial [Acromyrmex insinuator]
MSPSPTANRSFLHGNGKATLISNKVVYATLDSLALKRTRLPLQLLPVESDNVVDKSDKKEKKIVNGKTSIKRPSYKVKSGASHQWKSYSKCLAFSSTKTENQSTTRATRILDSGTECNIENTLEKEIQTSINTTGVENTVESPFSTRSSTKEESHIKDFHSDNGDSIHTQTETNSRDDSNLTENQCEKEKCSVERRSSNTSSDYEKISITDYKASMHDFEVLEKTVSESIAHIYKIEKNSPIPSKTITKSQSINDLATKETTYENSFVKYSKQDAESITSDENDDVSSWHKKKKKRRFTRNVLHYVPRHLVKQPKKKKKLKKKHALSSSLSSLRSLQTAPFSNISDSYKTRSLSRDELRSVIISSPTNFVHVASATNPSLVQNSLGLGLEQIVITHQQICATLPLLVRKNEQCKNGNIEQLKAAARMSPAGDIISKQTGQSQSAVDSIADKSDRTKYAEIQSDFSRDSQAAKVLESSQVVKIARNQADLPEETYEPVCESSPAALPQANCSFLWSNHGTKTTFPNDKPVTVATCHAPKENDENTDSEGYDDVGPSNFVTQMESDYDDVGPPTTYLEVETFDIDTNKDCEGIYDDVIPLSFQQNSLKTIDENDYLIPEINDETSCEEPSVELRATSKNQNAAETSRFDSTANDDQYFSTTNNEYSSVDCESHLNEEEREDELDVYDDVGLPGEERVNSLYAGSTPGSVLGLISVNGKESEWEDLEEATCASHCPCQSNDPRGKGTEGQITSGKKKLAQRWSRNVRKQRSRRSRRSIKTTRMTHDTTLDVAVSLGGGSVLLIGGEAQKTAEEWKSAGRGDDLPRRTQGLVQLRVISLDDDVDTQETSCYVHEDNISDDSTYESLYSCQPDDLSSDSETETDITRQSRSDRVIDAYLECPTRPTPPPPREASLTQSLGRRIKMLRRTWSITKGSLGRIRRRTSVDESGFDDKEQSVNEPHADVGKYFNFRLKHFSRKSIVGPPTFYLDENNRNDGIHDNNNGIVKEAIYTNSQYMGSGSDDSSRTPTSTDVDHYSVLADQEPLYQFYAAAVARVAFESDSEGYEEVEDMMRKTEPATADLTRAGQRMLWCHTPQVIHSDLLQAKFEILTSEASYLNSLRVLENEFLNNHILINEILTPIERKKLFGGVPSVLSASQTFLAELEAVWREDPMLPGLSEVLLKHAEKCQATYVAYCSNQVSIDTTLKELKARRGVKFLETVKRIEMQPACQNLSLHSFLMLPMQRVTRLPLLADAILSKLSMGNSDRISWEKVLSTLSNVVAECNEGARAAAQEAEMEALARKLEYTSKIKPIMLRGKQLVRSGSVVQLSTKTDTEYKLTFGKKFTKTPLYLLLLTDYLLVTKLKSNAHDECYTVIDACKRNLLALESASEESPFAGRNAMILTFLENHCGRHVEYILTCENNTERERWLEAVSPPKRGLVGETLYESWDCPQVMAKYPYLPNQPDELSLQSGDVINVLRKMADGWYHGEKLLDGEQGWFPANHTKEVASEHVRARNLKQRHRLLALSNSVIQQRRARQGY